MGQGALSTQVVLAAKILGAKENDVRVILADTDVVPDAGVTSASRTTYMVGNAIIRAAAPIRQSLIETAAELLDVHPDEIDMAEGEVFATDSQRARLPLAEVALAAWENNRQLAASGFYKMWQPDEPEAPFNYALAHSIFLYATQIVQILVDIELGLIRVEKVWAAHDAGKAINPLGIEGQIDGGVVQGLGSALFEQLQQDEGRLVNRSLEGYKLPTVLDYPDIEYAIAEVPEPSGPFGAKGIGEGTLTPMAPAIANALYDAVGIRIKSLPITPEKVLKALRARQEQKESEA